MAIAVTAGQLLALGQAADPRAAARERRLEAEKELRKRHRFLWRLIRWMARGLSRAYATRELGKSALVASIMPLRHIALDVGRRLVASGQLDRAEQALQLTGSDLRNWLEGLWDGRGARELAEDRRRRREAWLGQEPLALEMLASVLLVGSDRHAVASASLTSLV